MSYSDKCCGVCDEYQELYETGKTEYLRHVDVVSPKYKRFAFDKTNVCNKCIKESTLKDTHVSELVLNKDLKRSENITKGFTRFINPETDKLWWCHNSRLDKDEQHFCNRKLRFSKESPRLWEVRGKGINHSGFIFLEGCIYSYDKRQLRRVLRLLGVKGNIKHLIK